VTLVAVDSGSQEPPYEQVRRQLAEAVTSGHLVPGTRLPPVRRLAGDLGLAANTVARAYRELEQAGLVETRGRGGTVVTGAGDASREAVRAAAQQYVALASRLGLQAGEIVAFVSAAVAAAPAQLTGPAGKEPAGGSSH
jgi:DNA-binding transcriptional regulator YhcF (GntR family)